MAGQFQDERYSNSYKATDERSPLLSGTSISTTGGSVPSSFSQSSRTRVQGRGSKFLVVICILLTELCERLTFYGLTGNLLLFCSEFLDLTSPWPSTVNYLFQGTCYLVPIFGGWLADSYMGRFNVIYGSGLLYFVGTVLLAVVSIKPDTFAELFDHKNAGLNPTYSRFYFSLSLIMIAFGTGGIKANVSPFGADQVHHDGPRAVQRFFNWFYWFINIGSFVSFTAIVYIQQHYDFVYGYMITACTMLLAVITFVIGRNKYWNRPPSGSQLTNTVKIISQAIKNRKKVPAKSVNSWLDRAKNSFGGSFSEIQVEDVKALLRVIPVFITFIAYWMIYFQMQTTYLLQATYLRLKINGFTMPAASLSIFDVVSVLVLIPFMDHVVYPVLRACGIRLTPLQRIGIGMLLAASSVCVAGWVEIERKREMRHGDFKNQTVFGKTFNASDLNIFYQVPQFILIGASEVLTSITGLEFAYSQAPKCLQGLVMGCFLVTSGLGNYVANLLVVIVRSASHKKWYPSDNPNEGKLENFFFLLAGLMGVNFLVFLGVASSYKYKTPISNDQVAERGPKTVQPNDSDVG